MMSKACYCQDFQHRVGVHCQSVAELEESTGITKLYYLPGLYFPGLMLIKNKHVYV